MWIPIDERHPPNHIDVVWKCNNGRYYEGRPCYGMHAPWWCTHDGEVLSDKNIEVTHWAVASDVFEPENSGSLNKLRFLFALLDRVHDELEDGTPFEKIDIGVMPSLCNYNNWYRYMTGQIVSLARESVGADFPKPGEIKGEN